MCRASFVFFVRGIFVRVVFSRLSLGFFFLSRNFRGAQVLAGGKPRVGERSTVTGLAFDSLFSAIDLLRVGVIPI